jgi:hypothetical protein
VKNIAVPTMNYGRVVKGQPYRVLAEGKDYKILAAQGAPFYVFNWVFDQRNLYINNNNEEENDNG